MKLEGFYVEHFKILNLLGEAIDVFSLEFTDGELKVAL